jgi:flagellar hook-associated protein 1 FlgK
MSSPFLGYQIVGTALDAMQQAIDVASANISNAGTPGYSQQNAVLSPGPTTPVPNAAGPVSAGQFPEGVLVTAVTRTRQPYLDAQYRQQNAAQSYWQTLSTDLSNAEAAFQEPSSNGLEAALGTFFSDLNALASDPQSSSARAVVSEDAQNVATVLNTLAGALSQDSQNVAQNLGTDVSAVNQTLTEIASLNVQIQAAQTEGTNPNTLLDQRDTLLDQLSGYLPITVGTDAAGNLTVTENGGGLTLVDGGTVGSLAVNAAGTGITVTAAGASAASAVVETGGSIGAETKLLSGALAPAGSPGYASSLAGQVDALASSLASSMNALQTAGYYLDPTTGAPTAATSVPFFVASGGGAITAANLAVNPQIVQNGAYIAAAQTAAAADGSNAAAMAALGDQGPGSLIGTYTALVSSLGGQTAGAQSEGDTAQALTQQAQTLRQSVSGVSINEQMTQIVQDEQVYTAAAKAMGAIQDMVQSLLAVTP